MTDLNINQALIMIGELVVKERLAQEESVRFQLICQAQQERIDELEKQLGLQEGEGND